MIADFMGLRSTRVRLVGGGQIQGRLIHREEEEEEEVVAVAVEVQAGEARAGLDRHHNQAEATATTRCKIRPGANRANPPLLYRLLL